MAFDDKKYPDDEKSKIKDVIFCGDPGVGKSTLLSSITGVPFKSGISWTHGLTTKLEWKTSKKYPGFRFADTPGLADVAMAEKAATAITKALYEAFKKNHEVLLFFVVTDESGRTRSSDMLTIKLVMDSIGITGDSKDNLYSVIVNKMDAFQMPGWKEHGETMWRSQFAHRSEMVPYPTCKITFLPVIKNLVNKSDGSYHFEGLWEFMLYSPSFNITSVIKIQIYDMRYQMEKLQKSHQKMVKKLEDKMQLEKEKMKTQLKTMERNYKKKMDQEVEITKKDILVYTQIIERERKEWKEHLEKIARENEKRDQEILRLNQTVEREREERKKQEELLKLRPHKGDHVDLRYAQEKLIHCRWKKYTIYTVHLAYEYFKHNYLEFETNDGYYIAQRYLSSITLHRCTDRRAANKCAGYDGPGDHFSELSINKHWRYSGDSAMKVADLKKYFADLGEATFDDTGESFCKKMWAST